MQEGKQKSLDEAMLETLGKAEEEAPTEGQAAPEEQQEAQAETQPEQEQAAQEGEPEAGEGASAEDKPAEEVQAKEGKQPTTTPAKDGKAAAQPAVKPQKAGTPLGWPPELIGEFYALSRPVKNQILKQQGEMARERATHQKTAKEYAEVSKRYNGLNAAMEPFLPSLKALDVVPEAAVGELIQAHHVLRHGSKVERARLVAGLVRNFDVDVASMASELNGEAQADGQQPTQAQPPQQRKLEEFRDPRLDAMLAGVQRVRQQREQQARAQKDAELQQHMLELQDFAASGEAPHFDEVLDEMEIVNAAAIRKGENLTVQQVYERACYLNPKVRNLMSGAENERKGQEAQRTQQLRTRQALSAASSVKTEPSAPAGAKKVSLDEAILGLASRYGR